MQIPGYNHLSPVKLFLNSTGMPPAREYLPKGIKVIDYGCDGGRLLDR